MTSNEAKLMMERVHATVQDNLSKLDQGLSTGEVPESDYSLRRKAILDQGNQLRDAVKNKVENKYTELQKTGKTTIPGVTEKISTKGYISPGAMNIGEDVLKSDNAQAARKAALKLLGKKAMAGIPVLGGVYSAMDSGDVMAALPGLDAESLGPSKSSAEGKLESGSLDTEERQRLGEEGRSILQQQSDAARRQILEKLARK